MIFLAGLLTGLLAMVYMMVWFFRNQMVQVFPSPYGFEETVERVEKSINGAGWGIPNQLNINNMIAKKGLDLKHRIHITELCKPEYAKHVLEDQPHFAAMMPCRIGIHEKDGKVWLSKLNTGMMSKFLGGVVKEMMGKVSQEEHAILKAL